MTGLAICLQAGLAQDSIAVAEYGLMALAVVFSYALQELRPRSLHSGSLQDRQGGATGCLCLLVITLRAQVVHRWPPWHHADQQSSRPCFFLLKPLHTAILASLHNYDSTAPAWDELHCGGGRDPQSPHFHRL